jgi:hypothetical protein
MDTFHLRYESLLPSVESKLTVETGTWEHAARRDATVATLYSRETARQLEEQGETCWL